MPFKTTPFCKSAMRRIKIYRSSRLVVLCLMNSGLGKGPTRKRSSHSVLLELTGCIDVDHDTHRDFISNLFIDCGGRSYPGSGIENTLLYLIGWAGVPQSSLLLPNEQHFLQGTWHTSLHRYPSHTLGFAAGSKSFIVRQGGSKRGDIWYFEWVKAGLFPLWFDTWFLRYGS